MEIKNYIIMAVSVITAVVVFASVLPVFADTTQANDTFTNEGAFNLAKFTPTDEYTLVYDDTNGEGKITVNDTVVSPIPGVSLTNYGTYSILATDNALLRYGSNNSGYYLQIIGVDSGNNNVLTGAKSVTATISGGNLSVSYASDGNTLTKTFAFTEFYAIVPSDYTGIMKTASSTVYIKGDSELYASGITTVAAWNNMFHFEGTYDDGITISSPNLPSATFDNIEWNIEPVSGYIDLYELTSIEFDIIYNGTTTHATYSYFVVPSEVSAERAVHPDGATKVLMDLLPVLIGAGLLLGVAGYVIKRRM